MIFSFTLIVTVDSQVPSVNGPCSAAQVELGVEGNPDNQEQGYLRVCQQHTNGSYDWALACIGKDWQGTISGAGHAACRQLGQTISSKYYSRRQVIILVYNIICF